MDRSGWRRVGAFALLLMGGHASEPLHAQVPVGGQLPDGAQHPPGGEPRPVVLRVYLEEFGGPPLLPNGPPLGHLLPDLIQVELARLPAVEPRRNVTAPSCGEAVSRTVAQKSPDAFVSAGRDSVFYVITGQTEEGSPPAVSYVLSRCGASRGEPLLPGRQPISEENPLRDLLSIARAIAERLGEEIPRVGVVVDELEHGGGGPLDSGAVARTLQQRVTDAIWEAGGLEPVPQGGAYRIGGRVETREQVATVKVWLHRQDNGGSDTVSLAAAVPSVELFADTVASAIVRRLNRLRFAPRLAASSSLEGTPVDSLLEHARRALCDGVSERCTPSPDAAATAARVALERDSLDARALAILGRAELARSRPTEALAALQRASTLARESRRDGRPHPVTWETRLVMELADAYQKAGNYEAAARNYARAAELSPADGSVFLNWSRTLRSAGRSMEAIETVSRGLAANPDHAALRTELEAALKALPATEVLGQSHRLVTPCAGSAASRDLCAETLIRLGKIYFASPGAPLQEAESLRSAKELFGAALALDPVSQQLVAEASAYLAALHLGTISVSREPDNRLSASSPGFDREESDRYLRRAEAIAPGHLLPATQEWLGRLRSLYWLAVHDYEQARAYADLARKARATDQNATFLLAQADFLDAVSREERARTMPDSSVQLQRSALELYDRSAGRLRRLLRAGFVQVYPYLRDANARLSREHQTEAEVVEIARRPRIRLAGADLAGTLLSYCVDEMKDFSCGAVLATEIVRGGAEVTVDDTLNAIEASVLAGRLDTAARLLTPMLVRNLEPCRRLVTDFYGFWIAAAQGEDSRSRARFGRWRSSLREARDDGQTLLCWILEGAKARLDTEPEPPRALLLRQMLRAMVEPGAPVPELGEE
ncbi:MAG TPA: hypothetical protein VHG28_10730 [Longimicrobiaceae bacterium]|nr:hypothetical protein [Longimicrobiaceae bacterium]